MRLVPHESDNFDEFDLRDAIEQHLRRGHIPADEALWALVRALVDDYRELRLRYAGAMPPSLLQGVELLLSQQHNKNDELHEQEAGDDAPADGDFLSGVIRAQLAHGQLVVADLLCACMKAAGCAPIREAA